MTGESGLVSGPEEHGRAVPSNERKATIERICTRGETVRDEQVAEALARLGDDVSDEQREAVERLADRLVGTLLAVPVGTLAVADEETLSAGRTLFQE